MRYRSVATVVAVLLLVGLSGCSGVLPSDDGGGQAAEIRDQSTAAMANVSSYSFALELESSGQGRSISIDADGSVDLDEQSMQMVMTVQGIQVTQYIVDDTLYQETRGQWQRQDIAGQGIWEDQRRLEQQREILESGSISLEGEDTVDGESVYELSVDPDPADVEDVVSQQQGQATGDVSIDDVTYTVYVRQSDHLIKRVDADVTVSSQGQEANAEVTMTFSEFDEDMNIELPDEAENAAQAGGI